MKLSPLLLLILAGCTTRPLVVIEEQAAFETMLSNATSNYNESGSVIKVSVFRFDSSFIDALATRRAYTQMWSDSDRTQYAASLKEEHIGDGDSLTCIVFLYNTRWPCTPPMIVSPNGVAKELIPASMMPCSQPYIGDIWKHIWMENERGVRLRPILVSPPRHETLTSEEVLWVKFQIGTGVYNWFESSKDLSLVVEIESEIIKLKMK